MCPSRSAGAIRGHINVPVTCRVNDVSTTISQGSKMNLFADDIALYQVIKTPSDYHYLQTDVN